MKLNAVAAPDLMIWQYPNPSKYLDEIVNQSWLIGICIQVFIEL